MHMIFAYGRRHDTGDHRFVLFVMAITDDAVRLCLMQQSQDPVARVRVAIQRHFQPVIIFAKIRIAMEPRAIVDRIELSKPDPEPKQAVGEQRPAQRHRLAGPPATG